MVKYPSPLITSCGCSSMVEYQPSKLVTWVRFPSPAPRWSKVRFAPAYFFTCGRIISHPPASLLLLFRKKPRFAETNCAHSDLYYKNQSFAPLFLLTLQSRKDFAETPTYTCSVVTPSQRLAVATNLLRIFYRRIYNHIFFIVLRHVAAIFVSLAAAFWYIEKPDRNYSLSGYFVAISKRTPRFYRG